MRRLVRIVLSVAVLSVVVIVVLQFVRAPQTPASAQADPRSQIIDETVVTRSDLTVTVSGTGTVEPVREVGLRFEVTAPVQEILVEEGQSVRRGDVLARLDTTELEAALEDAQVALELQQVEYDDLVAPARAEEIAAAQAALDAALAAANAAYATGPSSEDREIARLQAELARNELWQQQLRRDETMELAPEFRGGETGAFTQEIQMNAGIASSEAGVAVADTVYEDVQNTGPDTAALGSANAQAVAARIELENLLEGPDDLELARAQIELARAEIVVEQAQAALDRAVLVAPFDGVIASHNLVVGELPPAEDTPLTLLDTEGFFVDVLIDETDISTINLQQPAEVSLDALPGSDIGGTVTRVAVTPTEIGEVVTYNVRVTLEDSGQPVRAGMSATATIEVSRLEDIITVPTRFVRIDRSTGQAFATIERADSQFEEVEVELGLRNNAEVQIVSGLEEGQRLVLLPRDTFNPFEN